MGRAENSQEVLAKNALIGKPNPPRAVFAAAVLKSHLKD
jgi:hypothetical protein